MSVPSRRLDIGPGRVGKVSGLMTYVELGGGAGGSGLL